MDANNGSFYSKEELDLNELENHQLFYDDNVSINCVTEPISPVYHRKL